MYIVSLGFDDGLLRSTLRTAELFEQFGLCAGFNVIATGGAPTFEPPDPWHLDPKGDFDLWNELQARGHEIMPHGYRHAHLGELPLAEAQSLIRRSLEIFEARLHGFDRRRCVYALPYNESTAALEAWLPGQVGAFRTGGDALNPLPASGRIRLTSAASGPAPCDDHLETQLARLFRQPEGWLVYTAHGLDDEGWGPLRSPYLEQLLERLLAREDVQILPATRALQEQARRKKSLT